MDQIRTGHRLDLVVEALVQDPVVAPALDVQVGTILRHP
jgi:hypothetical protein